MVHDLIEGPATIVTKAQRTRNRGRHRPRVRDRSEVHEAGASIRRRRDSTSQLETQTCLAAAATARQGQQPHLGQHLLQRLELGLPPHEARQLHRKVLPRLVGQPQRREPAGQIRMRDLANPHRTRHTPKPMFAQVDQLTALRKRVTDQLPRRPRHQDLTAMAGIHQPSRLVQHPPVVVIAPLLSDPRVQPHARPQRRDRPPRLALQRLLRGHRRRQRGRRRREHRVETITRPLDHTTAAGLDRPGISSSWRANAPCIDPVCCVPQRSRTLKIREEERDRPRRKHAHNTHHPPAQVHTRSHATANPPSGQRSQAARAGVPLAGYAHGPASHSGSYGTFRSSTAARYACARKATRPELAVPAAGPVAVGFLPA